mgnify:CR=1 FL=1
MQTEVVVSEFKIDEPKKGVKVMSKDYFRDNKSMVIRRPEEKVAKPTQSYINRYKSLKTMPSKSAVYGESCNYRRILVSPHSMMPVDRK